VDIAQKYIPNDNKVLFVHNTFLKKDEVVRLKQQYRDATFVLCPASNLFIERALPDVEMLVGAGVNISLGTDSLASSSSLSILDQISLIIKNFPQFSFGEILEWATINGARALGMEKEFGSVEIGKIPGLSLIYPFDFENIQPFNHSKVKRLI
jgi:cytosine/adenosine deaminase-related metal-dependent hydrolase